MRLIALGYGVLGVRFDHDFDFRVFLQLDLAAIVGFEGILDADLLIQMVRVAHRDLAGLGLRAMAHAGGRRFTNTVVLFRKSDVVAAGDLVDLTQYPRIDVENGGSLQAVVDSLNKLIDITVPEANAGGGTLVVPAYGRIADHAEVVYLRDMTAIVRDRMQDMIKRKMTLAQVKAAGPTREYDARYGRTTGPWTTEMFVEAAYKSLSK